jgi:hypothetical protein
MSNTNNNKYLSFVSMMDEFQLKDENNQGRTNGSYSSILLPSAISPAQQDKHNYNDHGDNDKNNSKMADTPFLGISCFDLTSSANIAKDMWLPEDYKGVVIQFVVPNSPAAKVGLNGTVLDVDDNGYLIRKGDVITSIDGNKVDEFTDIIKQMEKKKAGNFIDLVVNRNGARFHKSIMLEPISVFIPRTNL